MQADCRCTRVAPVPDAAALRPAHVARRAFTLVELLVVIGIIAALIALLLPALRAARLQANAAACLSNVRNLQVAQWMYAVDNDGHLVQAGFSHGGAGGNEQIAWFATLQPYNQTALVARCPSDASPHWDAGSPVPQSGGHVRRTSYGINNFLDRDLCPWGPGFTPPPPGGLYVKIHKVRRPTATVQFAEVTWTGPFAGTDHLHVENWGGSFPPSSAARHVQIDAHGGPTRSWESRATYGFLDGHAEVLRFRDVFSSPVRNRFDPAIAH